MMMSAVFAVAALVTDVPQTANVTLSDAAHAIEAGRLEQARLMIGQALAAGADRRRVDLLLADLSLSSGKHDEALVRYEALLKVEPTNGELCEKAALSAMRLALPARAEPWVTCATQGAQATWRSWNMRGALSDIYGEWDSADRAYWRASELAPDQPEVLNNQGWSRLLRGDWKGAQALLEEAARLAPSNSRILNNLDLARIGSAASLPDRRSGESAQDWAHRLNDAGVAAQLLGNRQKAIAAFTRALEASEIWYARAANNLAKATSDK